MAEAKWMYDHLSIDLSSYEDGEDLDLFISNYIPPELEHKPEMFDHDRPGSSTFRRFWQYLRYLEAHGTEIVAVVPIAGAHGVTKKILYVFKNPV